MYELIIFLILVTLGYVIGSYVERRHFKSIREREQKYIDLLAFSARTPPEAARIRKSSLVAGNVVISIDYFKKTAAALRGFFGGRVSSYESLIDRARREAVLRMKEQAIEQGANMVINVKLETSSISKGAKGQVGAVEVIAYGTGLTLN